MYKEKTISVVIPAFNEEQLIGNVIDEMPIYVDFLVIVDDASTDNTFKIVNEYKEKSPDRIIIIHHKTNMGVGGAIADGYKWSRDHNIDIAVVMGGDGQMDPGNLLALITPIINDEADYAKGNRLFTDNAWNKIPKTRYLGNSALSLLTKIASGYWHIADSQCGYTAINNDALNTIEWDEMYKRYGQPNDLLVRLNIYNFRVVDVEVRPIYGIGEKSGIKPILIIPRMAFLITKLFFHRMYYKYVIKDFHPLVLFYLLGFFELLVIAPILLIRLIVRWIEFNKIPPLNLQTLIFIIITGLQFTLFAMLFDMQYNNQKRK